MANLTFESSPQFERDLRHNAKERKRTKDAKIKWAYGQRHLSGVVTKFNWENCETTVKYSNEGQLAKMKPSKKYSDCYSHSDKLTVGQNKVKARPNWDTPYSVIKSRLAKDFTGGDINDVENHHSAPSFPASDEIFYSFDRQDSPDRPVTLEVFVKAEDAQKETARLVEKEYEVVDGNGEAVKGRRAKRVLKSQTSGRADREEEAPVVVEGGFELV